MEDKRRRNAKSDLPVREEVEAPNGGTPDDIVDAVRNLLMAPMMKKLREEFVRKYSRSLSADGVASMTDQEIFSDKSFEKFLADTEYQDVYACAKLVHKLLTEDVAEYKKFMKHLDKIWQSYCDMPFLKDEWKQFAPYRKKYWDSKEHKPRKLSDVMAKEEQAKNPPAPVNLVYDVQKEVFDKLLVSQVQYIKDQFKASDAFKALKVPKFKTDKEFALYFIDERNVDCYIAFEAFCKTKSTEYQHRYVCIVLLNKAMKNKDNYEVFMTHFHSAYKYMSNKTMIASEEVRQTMKKYHETYWNSHTNEPRPLGKDVQG